ncbi:MAG: NAD(P)-dependent oxidoreductase [Pseudomonadota bacterium]|nr:NAD(P)-dependent oxidoreductase [Pseudomonadota bacterium]
MVAAAMTIALTGATGFVGGHVLRRLIDKGDPVRALTRRPMDPRVGVTWIEGDLADGDALAKLVEGATSLIHIAGALNAPDAAAFELANVAGTAAVLAAAASAGVCRLVHVSSLAAREPNLSLYGASKARSEAIVRAGPLPFAIVRPPAVYGPGDRETLDLFRMANNGVVLLPPTGRLSLIHVDDLARLLITLADPITPSGLLVEPDDNTLGGFTHQEFAALLGEAVGKKVFALAAPQPMLRVGAALDRFFRRGSAKLTPDRVAYFCHPDWVVDQALAVPTELWRPSIATASGLRDTARWYRAQDWL